MYGLLNEGENVFIAVEKNLKSHIMIFESGHVLKNVPSVHHSLIFSKLSKQKKERYWISFY